MLRLDVRIVGKGKEEDDINEQFKFLIWDWYTTAGYEVPAVIYVTEDLPRNNRATNVQRAKAKLIMYKNRMLQ